jgi:hypothetical protein
LFSGARRRPVTLTASRHTHTARLAEFFRANPGRWIDSRDLGMIAGFNAWRTRGSDLRDAPYHMTIDNRQRRAQRDDGSNFIVSEYRYRPSTASARPAPSANDRAQVSPSPCECDGSGWRTVVIDGVERLARCACRQARRA